MKKTCVGCKFNEDNICMNKKHAVIEVAHRQEIKVKYRDIKDIKGCKDYDVKL